MSKTPFLFPLRAGDIAEFCHPDPSHPLAQPHFIDGDLSAGNGYLAIKATRGLWLEADFTPAPYEAKERISNLPWHNMPPADHPEWRKLDDIRGNLYQYGTIRLWTEKHNHNATPIWKVGGNHLIRLSHLQLISRLPASQIYCGPTTASSPAFVRFNGGTLLIPRDRRLQTYSREIFAPSYDMFTKERINHSTAYVPKKPYVPTPIPDQPVDNWPPADATEI